MTKRKIKILVVDDSSLVRQILCAGLAREKGFEVVGAAPDPYLARDMIVSLQPDVMTLDVEMPRMDGVEFLRRLMPQYPMRVVMVSSQTDRGKQITLEALEAGAVDFVAKPSVDLARGLPAMLVELATKIRIASTANVSHWKERRFPLPARQRLAGSTALAELSDQVIAIGASTGGTEAIRQVISAFSADTPGVVIVQHMPAGFTRMLAERLNGVCAMQVKEAETGDRLLPGRVLIAPGEKHMRLRRSGGIYQVECRAGAKVCGHCPSVDVMFRSVAEQAGGNAVGVILTGMGADGAEGLGLMKNAGARTMAQDEKSSVVFGMPKEAFKRGGAEKLVPLNKIAATVIKCLTARS